MARASARRARVRRILSCNWCHPERSEGSAVRPEKQILRFAQDDIGLLAPPCGSPHDLPWLRARDLSVTHDRDTVYQHVPDTHGELMRLLVRCLIDDRVRVEEHHVGVHPLA